MPTMPPPAVKGPPAAQTISPETPIPGTVGNSPDSDVVQRFLNHMWPGGRSKTLRPPADTIGARAIREQLGPSPSPVQLAVVTLPAAIGGTMPAPSPNQHGDLIEVEMKEPWKADP